MMYKMCYYRFGQVYTEGGRDILGYLSKGDSLCNLGKPPGYDRVRNAEIGNKDFELDVLEEAYTSEHWIVRIYKVGCWCSQKLSFSSLFAISGERLA